jgi:uncharacterized protein with ATP-grasp and redox domains
MISTNTPANIKQKFEVDGRCMDCQFKTFERLMDKFEVNYSDRQRFFGFFNLTMARGAALTMPQIHRELNNEFCRIVGKTDLFADEKRYSNELTLELYKELRVEVIESQNPFDMALRLSIAGNIIDYGPSSDFDIHQTIQKVVNSSFAIDQSIELETRIKSAKKILYIGDNAGEIVFDKLFIEIMMHNHLTYAVRGSSVLNDATLEDAHQVEMDFVADIISNGYDAPSTVLSECSAEFLKVYDEADIIISKGQGNLEGLIEENDARIFFLLMVKCDVVAEMLGVKKGDFVVYNNAASIK